MTAEEFTSNCKSLFGEEWVSELSKRLGVTPRSIKRWARGLREIPEEVKGIVSFWMGANDEQ